jgi:hypothetical protein
LSAEGSAKVVIKPQFGLSFYDRLNLYAELPLSLSVSGKLNVHCLKLAVSYDISIALVLGSLEIFDITFWDATTFASTSLSSGTLNSKQCSICGTCVLPSKPSSSKRMIAQGMTLEWYFQSNYFREQTFLFYHN